MLSRPRIFQRWGQPVFYDINARNTGPQQALGMKAVGTSPAAHFRIHEGSSSPVKWTVALRDRCNERWRWLQFALRCASWAWLYTGTCGAPDVARSKNACSWEEASAVSPERPHRASPRCQKDGLEGEWEKVTSAKTCYLKQSKLLTSFVDMVEYFNKSALQFLCS